MTHRRRRKDADQAATPGRPSAPPPPAGGRPAGCSDNCPADIPRRPDSAPDADGPVEVWCRAATQTGHPVHRGRVPPAQDRIRVELTPVPDAQFVTKLATAIRGGRVPDLVDIDDINSMLFIYRDAFTDLTDAHRRLDFRRQAQPRPPRAGDQGRPELRRAVPGRQLGAVLQHRAVRAGRARHRRLDQGLRRDLLEAARDDQRAGRRHLRLVLPRQRRRRARLHGPAPHLGRRDAT